MQLSIIPCLFQDYYNYAEPNRASSSEAGSDLEEYQPSVDQQIDAGGYQYLPDDHAAVAKQQMYAKPTMKANANWMDRFNYAAQGGADNVLETKDYEVPDTRHGDTQGFKSRANFETLLTEDNTGDYMNYNNKYDVNVIHSVDDNDNSKSDHREHKHGKWISCTPADQRGRWFVVRRL